MERPATNPAIVLIHGLWMTPRSWEHWIARPERSHFTVGRPGWEDVADPALNGCNEHSARAVLSTAG